MKVYVITFQTLLLATRKKYEEFSEMKAKRIVEKNDLSSLFKSYMYN